MIAGPVIVSAFLFFAILTNFLIRGASISSCVNSLLFIHIPSAAWLSLLDIDITVRE